MIDHLMSLRFTPGESLLAGLAVGAIVYGIARLVGSIASTPVPAVTTARPRTVIEFPPRPTYFHRDVDGLSSVEESPDGLYETNLQGLIRHGGPQGHLAYYSVQTKRAMAHRWPDKAFAQARMAASLAFALHPELREPAPRPYALTSSVFRSTARVH